MNKGLKLIDGLSLNMDHIVTVESTSSELIIGINMASEWMPDFLKIIFKEGAEIGKRYLGSEVEGKIYVEIQELYRIKCEISNYLGI